LVKLPGTHCARAALEDSYQLYLAGHQGYWSDLVYALQKLPFPVRLPVLTALTPDVCDALGKEVHTSAMKFLDSKITTSTWLYMLHDRLEPLENKPSKKITVVLCHYLELVENTKHRKAFTVERMRYKQRYHREIVPRLPGIYRS
jgi:hypothetical protein